MNATQKYELKAWGKAAVFCLLLLAVIAGLTAVGVITTRL